MCIDNAYINKIIKYAIWPLQVIANILNIHMYTLYTKKAIDNSITISPLLTKVLIYTGLIYPSICGILTHILISSSPISFLTTLLIRRSRQMWPLPP